MMDKVDGLDAVNSEWIDLEFFMDPEKPARRFKDG
jgi:hypothetical protein